MLVASRDLTPDDPTPRDDNPVSTPAHTAHGEQQESSSLRATSHPTTPHHATTTRRAPRILVTTRELTPNDPTPRDDNSVSTPARGTPPTHYPAAPSTVPELRELSTDRAIDAARATHVVDGEWMPVPPKPLAPTLGPTFSVAAARRAGHTPSRLRAHDLEMPFRGVRRLSEPAAPPDDTHPLAEDRANHARVVRDARAYFQIASKGTFVAGRSAAAVWMLSCDPGDDLCIGVFAPQRAPRRPGIHGVALSRSLTTLRFWDGLPVTSPATTWAMLGGDLTHRELVILGDAIVRTPRDSLGRHIVGAQLATPQQLATAALAPGRRHRAALLAALADIRIGSMSALETDFRLLAAAEGLPEPALDVEIRNARGRLLGIADAAYPDHRTLVEVEGDQHRTSRAQWLRDLDKHAAYVAEGYELVRLGAAHIRPPHPRGAKIVRTVLTRQGWTG